jgi:hypothetical protein
MAVARSQSTSASPVWLVGDDGNALGSASNPVNVTGGGGGGGSSPLPAGTNRGGTITTGGTAQSLAPANANRRSLTGQNQSAGDLWINEVGGTATNAQPSFRVTAGATFSISTNQAVSIWGATTGQAWSATEA